MTTNQLAKYFHYSANSIVGLNPCSIDRFLKENINDIKIAARYLLNKVDYKPQQIYRGVVLPFMATELQPHKNFTYLSFSESKEIATHFGDPTPYGFPSLYHLGDYGYVIEYFPKVEEVIFHYNFLKVLPYVDVLLEHGIDASTIHLQKEVTIFQPETAFKLIDYKEYKKQVKS